MLCLQHQGGGTGGDGGCGEGHGGGEVLEQVC